MPCLVISCCFIAHSYSGVRQDRTMRDELDWPPAPARLHQALMSSVLANLPASLRSEYAGGTLAALRWLEKLSPPTILANRLGDDRERQRPQVAMPHNSPAKKEFARYHIDLAPYLRAAASDPGALRVDYFWELSGHGLAEARDNLDSLNEAAAKLGYLGRAEDRVLCRALITRSGGRPSVDLQAWRPSEPPAGISLLAAMQYSTDKLLERFDQQRNRIARSAKPPARRDLRLQGYSCDIASPRLPVHISLFQIVPDTCDPDERPVSCDPFSAHRWRSPLRSLACSFAREVWRWADPALALELISGHAPDNRPTRKPHLAFVPLPSLSPSGNADGRVRRFALFGHANASDTALARSIYSTLASAIAGTEIEPGFRVRRLEHDGDDGVYRLYVSAGRVWLSATPVALARSYKVPSKSPDGSALTRNERDLRRLAEISALLRQSLSDAGLPNDLVASASITPTLTPLLPSTARAEIYRAPGDAVTITHVRLEFTEPVRGPLLIGDRRYQGLGLLLPER
ncbi:MAG: type I-U CRISPR-associated protein Cas5/Cas6 [Acidobacteria bacterium]|nr:MAG: type I-U CRISPR-associated protein Cas5/Cas6 [Acidobacteriota bacterium]